MGRWPLVEVRLYVGRETCFLSSSAACILRVNEVSGEKELQVPRFYFFRLIHLYFY